MFLFREESMPCEVALYTCNVLNVFGDRSVDFLH